jgi:hypothetical protein
MENPYAPPLPEAPVTAPVELASLKRRAAQVLIDAALGMAVVWTLFQLRARWRWDLPDAAVIVIAGLPLLVGKGILGQSAGDWLVGIKRLRVDGKLRHVRVR